MIKWREIKDWHECWNCFKEVAQCIDKGTFDLGRRHYAQSMVIAAMQAVLCEHGKIAVVELGVAQGDGLLDLCKSANFFRNEFGIEVMVYGFDNAAGLPAPVDYRDHPEVWQERQFAMPDPDVLRRKLPGFCQLVIGDVGETIPGFASHLKDMPLAFVSVDVDYYSSTKRAMGLFGFDAGCYLPAMPVYFDDMTTMLTWNEWCGEELAIKEFNEENALRKITRKDNFNIPHFHVLQVLDHPLRTGLQKPRSAFPLVLTPLR